MRSIKVLGMFLAFLAIVMVFISYFAMTNADAEELLVSVPRASVKLYAEAEEVLDDFEEVFGYRPEYIVFEDDRVAHVLLLNNIVELPVVIDEPFGRVLIGWEIPETLVEENSILSKYNNGGTLADLSVAIQERAEMLSYEILNDDRTLVLQIYDIEETKDYEFSVTYFSINEEGQIYLPANEFRQAVYFMTFL